MSNMNKILEEFLSCCIERKADGLHPPDLVAFISGWYLGMSGADLPCQSDLGRYPASFTCGFVAGEKR